MSQHYPYESPVEAACVEMDAERLHKVVKTFLKQQVKGQFPGGQLCVRRFGQVALNVSCGIARGWHGRGGDKPVEVKGNTPFAVYSTGKPMAAILVALLEARGLIDIQDPVCKYLPEFASLGREEITVVDVLTHKAGIILTDLIHLPHLVADREAAWQHLLKTKPLYPRGTFAYMPTEYGMILDQLILNITGKTATTLFETELVQPLGLNNISYGLGQRNLNELGWAYWLGKPSYKVVDMDVAEGFEEKNNSHAVFSAANPAISMVADAANLAALYEFLVQGGQTQQGEHYMDANLLGRYTRKQVAGYNKSIKTYLSFGHGFMLGTLLPSFFGWWGTQTCFGHPGMFSSFAFADHKTKLAIAIVTNGNAGIGDFFNRMVPLVHNIRKSCN